MVPTCLGNVSNEQVPVLYHESAIGRLPAEILSHIFVLAAEESAEDDDDSTITADYPSGDFATLCSHVCAYWRYVVIETPQLWTHIDFVEGPPFEKSKEWISRSKGAPLVLDVDHSIYPDDQIFKNESVESFTLRLSHKIQIMASLIMPHAYRWSSLEISADRYEIIWLWQTHLESCRATPSLEYLGLLCHEAASDKDSFQPSKLCTPRTIVLDAPKLNAVDLWGVHISWTAATFLKNLKSLQLAYHTKDVRPSVEQFVCFLGASPHIEALSLESSGPRAGDWPTGRIALNSLHKLDIIGIDVLMAIAIVDHVEFPALRDLTLDLDEDEDVETFIAAVSQDGRSRFRDVETIKLVSFSCDPLAAFQFLRSMPNISSMTLDFSYLCDNFCDALTHKCESCQILLCPKLRTLKISGLDQDPLRELISTRKGSPEVESIQRLYLDQEDMISDNITEWLKNNVDFVEIFENSDVEYESDEDDEDEDESDEDDEDDESDEDDENDEDDEDYESDEE